jgi:presenilin-like A22 family membrane protease
MKHNVKITIIILTMFLITQFIGLYVVDTYAKQKVLDGEVTQINATKSLPYGMEMPEEESMDYKGNILSIVISLIIAISILYLLTHVRAKVFLKGWFFFVTTIALGISFYAIIPKWQYGSWISLIIAIPLAFTKIYKRNFFSHNISELLVYPGIAAVFVPLLNIKTVLILLGVISVYDAWAVWRSKIMQKMAKYQMNELKIFSGFYIPYASKKQKEKIKKMKESEIKKNGVKVNVAILGGGDVIFPIITAGVVMKFLGLWPAIFVIFGALLGLGSLLFLSEKKKFYPAMPFITGGIIFAMILSWLLL